MINSYKFRLYPNQENIESMSWVLEQCRLIYNRMLEQMKKQEKPDRFKLQAMLPIWKKDNPELRKIHSKTLQYEVYRLFSNTKALNKLKKKGMKIGKLRFKGKGWFKTFIGRSKGNNSRM